MIRRLILTFLCASPFVITAVPSYSEIIPPMSMSPEIDSIGPQSVFEGDTLSFRVTASDGDGDTIFLSAEEVPLNATFVDSGDGVGGFTFAPDFTQGGDYEVLFIASDGFLADSEVVVISVNQKVSIFIDSTFGMQGATGVVVPIELDNQTNLTTPVAGVQVTLAYDGQKITATGARTTPRSYGMTVGTTDTSAASDSILILMFSIIGDTICSGTGPIIEVLFDVEIMANGTSPLILKEVFLFDKLARPIAFDKKDGIFSIDLLPPRPPVLAAIPDTFVSVGYTLELVVRATDANGDSIVLDVDNLLDGAATFLDNGNGVGIFTFTPDSTLIDSHLVVFYASDGALADTEEVVLAVTAAPLFIRGDIQADGDHDIFDAIYLLNWLGGVIPPPSCIQTTDIQDDEDFDIFDAIYLLNWLGGLSGPPPSPCCDVPANCGPDPTPGEIPCAVYSPCAIPKAVADKTVLVGRAEASWIMVAQVEAEGEAMVTVPIIVSNDEPVLGFCLTLAYDDTYLTALLVDNSDLETEGFDYFVGGVEEPGVVTVLALKDMGMNDGIDRLPAGEHEVARIVFQVKEPLVGDVPLNVLDAVMPIDHIHGLRHELHKGAVTGNSILPMSFELSQNYPNPFNSLTGIRYALPEDCWVRLEVFNLLGQRVVTVVDEYQRAGLKTVRWNARGISGDEVSSGIYLYRISAGAFESVRRMVLLR